MARARSGDKERFWRALLDKQAKSGLSVGKFCTGVGVSPASFFGWKRELGRRDANGGRELRLEKLRFRTMLQWLGKIIEELYGVVER